MIQSTLFIISTCLIVFCNATNKTKLVNLFNYRLEGQNPSSVWPPRTDSQEVPDPFKYPFALAHKRVFSGGWNRFVQENDLPISKNFAGIQSYVPPGGIRELHWHVATEWAYVLYGCARITVVDDEDRAFIAEVEEGDIWVFPGGFPHSIQSIGKEGIFFIATEDNGTSQTLPLSDWLLHTPRDVLAKDFQVPPSTFKNIPRHVLEFFMARLPMRTLEEDLAEVAKGTGLAPESFVFKTNHMKPNITRAGGTIKTIDKRNFPVTNIASAIITLHPGALREMHWHPRADEWQYYIKGKARMTVFKGGEVARTMDFQTGDVGYAPKSNGHYIENTGSEDMVFLAVFNDPFYSDIGITSWLAHTPPVLVNEHIRTGLEFIKSINKTKAAILP